MTPNNRRTGAKRKGMNMSERTKDFDARAELETTRKSLREARSALRLYADDVAALTKMTKERDEARAELAREINAHRETDALHCNMIRQRDTAVRERDEARDNHERAMEQAEINRQRVENRLRAEIADLRLQLGTAREIGGAE